MILIKNGTVFTMENDCEEKLDILIEKGKIVDIGKNIDPADGTRVIDASGKFVFPGFIDSHCHIGLWEDSIGFEGADGNEITAPITPELRAIDAINPMDINFEEARNGGITLVATGPGSANVIGGQFVALKTYGKRVDDMIVKAPLAMKCAFGENPKRCYADLKKSPSTRMAIASEFRNALFKAKEYSKKKNAALEDPSKAPEFNFQMEALLPVINKEIHLKAHAHRADDILTAIRISKEFDVRMTIEHCTEGHLIADILKEENIPAIVGPSLCSRPKFELKNLTFETPGILEKAGVKIAIMTDHPVIPLQYLPTCAALSVKSGMSKMGAYRAITINAAEILEIDERVGSLKIGKDADIAIWDRDPFTIESNVLMTIIDGKIVYEKNSL